MKRFMALGICLCLALGVAGCREEGPAEKAGRKVDDAVDRLRYGDEGALEKAGREFDEKLEEAVEAVEDSVKEAREAIADAIEDDEDS